jgi:hypothetical protein
VTLQTKKEVADVEAAARLTATTLATAAMSRDCSPSPWIVGRSRLRMVLMNPGMTVACRLFGAWREPRI